MAKKIKFYRKTTNNISLTFPGVDLTGATVYLTVKPEFDDSQEDITAVIAKDVTSHIDPAEGITRIPLTPEDTNVPADKYVYDIKLKKSSGESSIVAIGQVTIENVATLRS